MSLNAHVHVPLIQLDDTCKFRVSSPRKFTLLAVTPCIDSKDMSICFMYAIFMMNGLYARRDITLYAFRCPRFHRIARLITRIIVKVLLTLTQIELNIVNVNIESSDQSIQNPIHHKSRGSIGSGGMISERTQATDFC